MVNSFTLDIDNDGDTDYVSGNFGENIFKGAKYNANFILAKILTQMEALTLLFLISS